VDAASCAVNLRLLKAAFITLLLLLLVCLAADLWFTDPGDSVVFTPQARERVTRYIPAARPVFLPEKKESPPAPVPSAKKEMDDFVPPQFESLETLTEGWTRIPASAFPRDVRLLGAVEFGLPSGTLKSPVGASAVAHGMQHGLLTVSPAIDSKARASIPYAMTDFRPQIEASYQKWILHRTDLARQQWARRKGAMTIISASSVTASAEKGRPVASADGSYPLLLASMKAGEVTEITPGKIKHWGRAAQREIDGTPTWCIDVVFGTMVFCGPIDATAQARVRDGRVIAWVYPGSGEPVP
jgi:hypothetical protein